MSFPWSDRGTDTYAGGILRNYCNTHVSESIMLRIQGHFQGVFSFLLNQLVQVSIIYRVIPKVQIIITANYGISQFIMYAIRVENQTTFMYSLLYS